MGSIVRGIERGLVLAVIIICIAVSVVLMLGNYGGSDWVVAYVELIATCFSLYGICFRIPLQKLRSLNEMIRLGVHSIEDIKSKTSAVKINNERLRKNKHYRIQVTDRIVKNLKSLKWCGKKIGRVAASYAAFHIDNEIVLMDIILAMRDETVIAEVFRRRLLQLDPLDNEWFCLYLSDKLKVRESFPFDNDVFLFSLCEKIYKVCVSYNDERSVCVALCVAINYLLDQHPKPDMFFEELKAKTKSAIGDLLVEKRISQEMHDKVSECFS